MKTNVRVIISNTKLNSICLDNIRNILPETVEGKIKQYNLKQQRTHWFAWLIAKEFLTKSGENIDAIYYNNYGKPMVNGNINFSISVSYKFVAVAFAPSSNIGIDIEQIRDVNIFDFRNEFSQREWDNINNGGDIKASFFRFWTQKESILKAYGTGLSQEMKNVKIENGVGYFKNKTWYLYSQKFNDNLIISVALPVKDYTVEFLQYDIEKETITNNV